MTIKSYYRDLPAARKILHRHGLREEAPGSYEAPAREARPLRSQFYCAVILRSCTERRMAPKGSPDTELTRALGEIAKPARQARIPKQLPVYVIAGTRDPVSANSKGLEQLLSAYHAAGLQRVTCRFYPEARHELFNETNRDKVTRELLAWLVEATGHGEYSGRGRPQPTGHRSWA